MEQAIQLVQSSGLPAPHESIDEEFFVARDENNVVYTTSVSLAQAFNASHDNMLKSIRRLRDGNLFKTLDQSFWDMTYKSKQNKELVCIGLNSAGLTIFFMNYPGDLLKKYRYISLFKSLENSITASYNVNVAIAQPVQLTPRAIDISSIDDDTWIAYGMQAAYRKIQFLERVSQEQQDQIQYLGEEIEARQQAVDFMEAVNNTETTISIRELSTFINQVLKKAGAKKSDLTGQNRLFKYLIDNGFIFKHKGSAYYSLMQKAVDMDVLSLSETPCGDNKGIIHMSRVVRVTGKGQQYFCGKFLDEFNNKYGGTVNNGIQRSEVWTDVHNRKRPEKCMGQNSADERA